MFKTDFRPTALLSILLLLTGCAANASKPPDATSLAATDHQRINELERQLAERQRLCLAEKRRLELALKESQKQNEELQAKIDALRAIDRELRTREKSR